MAALLHPWNPEVVELRHLRGADLQTVLDDQVRLYRDQLQWDFRPSADLVYRFADMQSLCGCAIRVGRQVAGYSFYVLDEDRGLIGDLYVREDLQTPAFEFSLLQGTLDVIRLTPYLRRMESQILITQSLPPVRWDGSRPPAAFPLSHVCRGYPRLLLGKDIDSASKLARGLHDSRFVIEKWSQRHVNEGGHLVELAYRNHVDAEINDQYGTAGGARRFLTNIVQFPGCGAFFGEGSFAAWDPDTGRMAGLCLTSLVSPRSGHITQLCTAPWAQRIGLGSELLRRSMLALALAGCHQVTLTVTASNRGAMRLYEHSGFTVTREFTAYSWEGFA